MQLTKHWAVALDDYVIDLAWSQNGAHLAAASAAGPVFIHAVDDGARVHELPGHADGTNTLAWSPDGLYLATGGQDGQVKLWDPRAGQHTATASFERAWVEFLAWQNKLHKNTPDAPAVHPLLAVAAGRQLRLLGPDAATVHAFAPAPKTISAMAWNPHGDSLAVAYFGGVCIWNTGDFSARKEFPYANGIHALAWSPDGKWLVSGNQDSSVHLWIPESGFEFHMSGYDGKVKEISFDHSSRWLATGGGRDACVWDCQGQGPEGREPVMLPHDVKVCGVAYQNTHSILATAAEDGVLMLWSPERAQPLRATVRIPSPATKLAWSPNDRYLAVGSAKGVVYVLKCEA